MFLKAWLVMNVVSVFMWFVRLEFSGVEPVSIRVFDVSSGFDSWRGTKVKETKTARTNRVPPGSHGGPSPLSLGAGASD